jgi:hypothetical protein
MEKICKNCRRWSFYINVGKGDKVVERAGRYGLCDRGIKFYGYVIPGTLAVQLKIHETFGCVLWKERLKNDR